MNMTWNHRVVNCPSENGGGDFLTFREVHYDDGRPVAYGDVFMCGDTQDELKELVKRLERALAEPVLHENEFGEPSEIPDPS